MAESAKPTRSGIQKMSNGESVIPSSTRADGSVRKEIRVKPGYRPPEDVEVYKNRTAEAWKNRGKVGIPGAGPAADEEEKLPPHKAAAAKNLKRREARKKAAAAEKEVEIDEMTIGGDRQLEKGTEDVDPEAEKAKEARKLAKKLRQARELKDKKDNGDNLLPEQFEKVIRMNELIRQLDKLGFDAKGEKRPATGDKKNGDKPTD